MSEHDPLHMALELARKRKLKDVDLVLQRNEHTMVEILERKVDRVEHATSMGIGVRVLVDGRTGYASTERLDEDALSWALDRASDNAKLQDAMDVVMPEPDKSVAEISLQLYNPALDSLTTDQLSKLGLEVEAAALASDSRVAAIPDVGVATGNSETRFLSSHGVEYSQRRNQVQVYCEALLEEGESRKSDYEVWTRRSWDPAIAKEVGERAVQKTAAKLGASPISSSALPVILDEYCAPRLLGLFMQGFYGEAAQKGMSRLNGRQGEQVAAPAISLTDNPHLVGAAGSTLVDGEGVATAPLALIEEGEFKSFLYHIESARREKRESTGHASRGYTSSISTGPHNLVMAQGTQTLEQLCSEPSSCLLVTDLEGSTGCNAISGDISIGVQGFLIENGKRVQPVDSVTIAGNFFDLLKNIRAIGNAYQPNLTRTFVPALLIEGLTVSS